MSSINERIAKVKGFGCYAMHDGGVQCPMGYRNWQYSIADAWELVEEIAQKGYVTVEYRYESGIWACIVDLPKGSTTEIGSNAQYVICLAYLAVMEAKASPGSP